MTTAEQAMVEMLAEIRNLRGDLAERPAATSSCELSENAKGAVQVTLKAYAGSPVDEAVDHAVAEFARAKRLVERAAMQQWQDTLEVVRAS